MERIFTVESYDEAIGILHDCFTPFSPHWDQTGNQEALAQSALITVKWVCFYNYMSHGSYAKREGERKKKRRKEKKKEGRKRKKGRKKERRKKESCGKKGDNKKITFKEPRRLPEPIQLTQIIYSILSMCSHSYAELKCNE